MIIEDKSWKSKNLDIETTIRVIGEDGTPVLLLPDQTGDRRIWEKNGLVESISIQLENGYNQLFCIDIPNIESFIRPETKPEISVSNYNMLESYIIEEVIPFMVKLSGDDFIIITGVELGALISMNLVLKYPFEFGKIITIGGLFDPDVMYHPGSDKQKDIINPMTYLENLTDRRYLDAIQKLDIRIAVNANDPAFDQNQGLSEIMNRKGVPHVYDVWNEHPVDKWSGYCDMFLKHIE